ncbi:MULTISPECIES: ABC transporter ATP-binding protein [Virgibacillus]|uniref:ABC transporter ATP-binding protein n=1 Tax=Virgibacillus TaxID=84406 RepID=UPI0002F32399|nr:MULTISPECIES: ABC transporter ATP-binding protein [Virgibacillus]AIF44478.1 peptide ABC transporter ATP-binding protein [Virgibacillus sp. SK37]MCG1027146.1 ABC transporter ATP-binding protein [Virgibacillus halodenitrificans]MEC2159668.1 ABC transporter ATP-binding protein [Virgibacillus halodenitrificans]
MSEKVLEIEDLKTYFHGDEGTVKAVDGVSITVGKGETVGVVGESGCGKSVTSLSTMRLLHDTPGKIVGGTIKFEGKNLLELSEREMRQLRGNDMAMIFQEPMTSLNPVYKIGKQLEEVIRLHMNYNKKQAQNHAVSMLKMVGLPRAEEIINEYPFQLSGGMRQRVMIAMAMACNPKLLIADEPTTALDVTIQAQILDLMRKLRDERDTAIMLITHDLGVVAEMCDRVVVMYAGKVVEETDVETLFKEPQHPYTKGLIASIPKLGENAAKLESIPGNVPTPANMPQGCKFAPRCKSVMDICWENDPDLLKTNSNHTCRCWLYQDSEIESKEDLLEVSE